MSWIPGPNVTCAPQSVAGGCRLCGWGPLQSCAASWTLLERFAENDACCRTTWDSSWDQAATAAASLWHMPKLLGLPPADGHGDDADTDMLVAAAAMRAIQINTRTRANVFVWCGLPTPRHAAPRSCLKMMFEPPHVSMLCTPHLWHTKDTHANPGRMHCSVQLR